MSFGLSLFLLVLFSPLEVCASVYCLDVLKMKVNSWSECKDISLQASISMSPEALAGTSSRVPEAKVARKGFTREDFESQSWRLRGSRGVFPLVRHGAISLLTVELQSPSRRAVTSSPLYLHTYLVSFLRGNPLLSVCHLHALTVSSCRMSSR